MFKSLVATGILLAAVFSFAQGDFGEGEAPEESPFDKLYDLKQAVEAGRTAKPGLKVGICGEHGGEPKSIGFCHKVGLSYVSCSPFRVPIARLAAAQAALGD